jgi:hypothetical protein
LIAYFKTFSHHRHSIGAICRPLPLGASSVKLTAYGLPSKGSITTAL